MPLRQVLVQSASPSQTQRAESRRLLRTALYARGMTSPLPPALTELLDGYDARQRAWEALPAQDRQRYVAWVLNARTPKQGRRRAVVVIDRVRDGRRWVGPVRRLLEQHFTVPAGTTAYDAYNADHNGSSPFG